MVEYLKAENRILRDKLPKWLTVTARERNRLMKLGRRLPPSFCTSGDGEFGQKDENGSVE